MAQFQIFSSECADLGIYEGETAADALDAMARDAGYKSQADCTAQGVPFTGSVTEISKTFSQAIHQTLVRLGYKAGAQ